MADQLGSNDVEPAGAGAWWLEISDHLGGIYPFYDTAAPDRFSFEIEPLIASRRARGEAVELDPIALACKACLPYLLADRTLVRGVARVPWVAQLGADHRWTPADLPPHGRETPTRGPFVERLKAELLTETAAYLAGADTVGILLSGGMDSRVVAGAVRELQLTTGQPNEVVAITWGQSNARDVVYAGRIAEQFGWELRHFPLDVTNLSENIETAGRFGAEFSALHLHAMPRIAEIGDVDVILAGSYGDSVGRAEFSGSRLGELASIVPRLLDRFGLLRTSLLREAVPAIRADAVVSPHLASEPDPLRRHEIQQELHYMRRMLQACMQTMCTNVRLYQLFTAPAVFRLMWSLDPKVRDDEWYRHLLPLFPGDLLDIPWARTGKRYPHEDGAPDQWSSRNNELGTWLRRDLRDLVVDRVNSDVIRGLGIFNDRSLDNALAAWGRARTRSTNALDEVMAWLASLHVFIERNELALHTRYATSRRDRATALAGRVRAETYVLARNQLRD